MSSNCDCASCGQPPRWQRESHPDFDTVFSMLRQDGFLETDRDRPIIGVCNTWNEIVPGHLHLRDLAEQVKLGIRSAGGVGPGVRLRGALRRLWQRQCRLPLHPAHARQYRRQRGADGRGPPFRRHGAAIQLRQEQPRRDDGYGPGRPALHLRGRRHGPQHVPRARSWAPP